jgi:hypothetical protein
MLGGVFGSVYCAWNIMRHPIMFLSSTDKLSHTLVTLQTELPVLQQSFSCRANFFFAPSS